MQEHRIYLNNVYEACPQTAANTGLLLIIHVTTILAPYVRYNCVKHGWKLRKVNKCGFNDNTYAGNITNP